MMFEERIMLLKLSFEQFIKAWGPSGVELRANPDTRKRWAQHVEHIRHEIEELEHRDGCQLCYGTTGGRPGQETVLYDINLCEYCALKVRSLVERVQRGANMEIRRLRAELARVTMQRDILREASGGREQEQAKCSD